MLSRQENEVMKAVYGLCDGTDSCLISALDITSVMPAGRKPSADRIDGILHDLALDGYFELIVSERKGERVYVITLKHNGFTFMREARQRRRDVMFRIGLALIGACATFIFGAIIKSIFG